MSMVIRAETAFVVVGVEVGSTSACGSLYSAWVNSDHSQELALSPPCHRLPCTKVAAPALVREGVCVGVGDGVCGCLVKSRGVWVRVGVWLGMSG